MSATRFALCGVVFLLQLTPALVLAAEVGSFVPEFSLPSLHDPHETVDIASNRGKLLYVDFWSAWCKPCREKMTRLDQLRSTHETLEVVGINVDALVSDAYQFVARHPVSYPIGLDISGEAARDFGVETLPVGFLIDQQGIVRAVTKSGNDEEIEKLTYLVETLSFSMSSAETAR